MSYGRLYLLPVFLGTPDPELLSKRLIDTIHGLRQFVVENEKTARAFLKSVGTPIPQTELSLEILDEHTDIKSVPDLLKPLLNGNDVGLMSEAGCPGIADPGSELVRLAHLNNIQVVPLAGPSSILLGLMASGLNGQRFRFLGYLPREGKDRIQTLKELEREVYKTGETQIFIETPYRNQQLLEDILNQLDPELYLSIGCELNDLAESCITRTIGSWKKQPPSVHKRPCIFLIGRPVANKTTITSTPSKGRRLQPPRYRR